jgi:hypothetical protein
LDEGVHLGHDLIDAEGLGKVCVTAYLKTLESVLAVVEPRKKHERDR